MKDIHSGSNIETTFARSNIDSFTLFVFFVCYHCTTPTQPIGSDRSVFGRNNCPTLPTSKRDPKQRREEDKGNKTKPQESREGSRGMTTLPPIRGQLNPKQGITKKRRVNAAAEPHHNRFNQKSQCCWANAATSHRNRYIGETGRPFSTRKHEHHPEGNRKTAPADRTGWAGEVDFETVSRF